MALSDKLGENPVVAAVKNEEGLEQALASDCTVVFLLCGSICSVPRLTRRAAEAGKTVFVHADLIDGLASRDVSADFLREYTPAHGIISTKPSLIRRAKERGLGTVQRFFLIDSLALENLCRQLEHTRPELIEILPGVMPKVLRRVTEITSIPVIAGGLIRDKEDILAALDAGAAGISSTDPSVWFL